jgi:hypothetical protein
MRAMRRPLSRALGLLACGLAVAGPVHAYRYTISPPVTKGETPPVAAAPLRKDEAQARDEIARLQAQTLRITVEGQRDGDQRMPAPRSVEQKFADALNEGNPEVAGGWIRHGMYYDGVFYWGRDPLSFIYNNVRGSILDTRQ